MGPTGLPAHLRDLGRYDPGEIGVGLSSPEAQPPKKQAVRRCMQVLGLALLVRLRA